jgi:purine-nucleoside phosphorylase
MNLTIENYFSCVDESAKWLRKKVKALPEVVVVLSGGLSGFLDSLEVETKVVSTDIPNFPSARCEGHKGEIAFGTSCGMNLAVMSGRYHYYEGHPPYAIVFPYFVFAALGAKTVITTNAVGGMNKNYRPGDVMMVRDHINFMGINPLIGLAIQRKTDQFTNMTEAYDAGLRDIARQVAKASGLDLKEGVYVATSGPSYETKAEISALRELGADAVGMSTVPEVIACNFLGLKVLSFSCIANAAADLHEGIMSHKEVLEAMQKLAPNVVGLLKGIVKELSSKK